MKHIKIFEEFTPDQKPIFEPEQITDNEEKLIEMKTGSSIIKYEKKLFLLYNEIEKMPDGFWLVNKKTQCSSINDMIKVCNENSKEPIEKLHYVLDNLTENEITGPINKVEYSFGSAPLIKRIDRERSFYIKNSIKEYLIMDDKHLSYDGIQLLIQNIMREHFDYGNYHFILVNNKIYRDSV